MTTSDSQTRSEEPSQPTGRRERERNTRRSLMLEAARAVFADRGFTGATLDEIAARAEFGKGTLYNYFPGGKDEILFAVFDEIYDDLAGIIEASFPPADKETTRENTRAWFSDFIHRCFAFYESRAELFLIMVKEAHSMCLSPADRHVEYFLGQRQRITRALAIPVQRAMDAGAMRRLPANAVAGLLFGNINGLQLHRALDKSLTGGEGCSLHDGQTSPPHPEAAESAAFLTSFLFDGLLLDNSSI